MIGKSDLWYKQAIIYSLDVETFMDGNGDGVGDFIGLTSRLDYLAGLGVSCLWLLPFYPSPNRDNGYDVMDYYGVDHRLGTLGDFVDFMRQAREHGMRVVVDLVANHTSNQHPWFQQARQDADSPYRDYYVWAEEKPADADEGVIFPGEQESIWTYDEEADAYYLHRFYKHQPDLNIANPAVREEIRKTMGFWLELGVSGFRVDAAPFLIEFKGIEKTNVEVAEPYEYLHDMREFVQWRRGDAILLAEANVPPEKIPEYFGGGNAMHMLFNFLVNQHLFLALARRDSTPIREAMDALPDIPSTSQWANFLRNHDELDLGRLTEEERQEAFEEFAPKENMRLYGRGIRRRLPPMLDGDWRRLRMAYSLMFSLPGTPVIRYGQEIGMGDDLSLDERNSVRTVMQWANEQSGGFSTAPPDELVRPVIQEGDFGYPQVNVRDQTRDPDSFLNWMERIIRTRRACPELGWGECEIIPCREPSVFAHRCSREDGGAVIAVHNLSDQFCTITLEISDREAEGLTDLLGDEQYEPVSGSSPEVHLEGYGFRWFRVDSGGRMSEGVMK